ncbi:hypothetical protein [Roseomonas indoligenes]|uniref:Uncharacterized protein n=1 Tax=Roseomonas indoligenes TaxID=2820811 RepID=A0A940S7Q0_9PROT|nr:hypothetical protein [Pararoseomonas indoligenes]MBP0495284.1 hypothetical protein [Pararoseomonas indoligenes]
MDRSLDDPPRPGSVHRFKVRFPGYQPQIIDYLDDESIHLHVSLRPAAEVIVVNDRIGGTWNAEVQLPLAHPRPDGALLLELHFGVESLEVWAGGQRAVLADRRGIVSEARVLRTTEGVSLLQGETGLPDTPAITASAISLPAGGGRFAGAIDRCSEALVRGWAADLDRPGSPVEVEVRVDGRLQGRTLANRMRNDLVRMRPELGGTGFLLRFPRPLEPTGRDVNVSVHIAGQPVELAHSPWSVFRAVPDELRPLGTREEERL